MSTPSPATSTLFPYTTLFRSCAGAVVAELHAHMAVALGQDGLGVVEHFVDGAAVGVRVRGHGFAAFAAEQDRKSTRLNSSHVKISYAVVCLKKKEHSASGDLT